VTDKGKGKAVPSQAWSGPEGSRKLRFPEFMTTKKIIVRFMKSKRLRWAAHIIGMDKTRTMKKLIEWEPCSSRPAGRPRLRWLDQVEEDLKKMNVRNWRQKCKDRRLCNEIVKQAKTHQEL